MFSCYYINYMKACFHVFSPFNAHFFPTNDVVVHGPFCECERASPLHMFSVWNFVAFVD